MKVWRGGLRRVGPPGLGGLCFEHWRGCDESFISTDSKRVGRCRTAGKPKLLADWRDAACNFKCQRSGIMLGRRNLMPITQRLGRRLRGEGWSRSAPI
jgi:hypothetical protein